MCYRDSVAITPKPNGRKGHDFAFSWTSHQLQDSSFLISCGKAWLTLPAVSRGYGQSPPSMLPATPTAFVGSIVAIWNMTFCREQGRLFLSSLSAIGSGKHEWDPVSEWHLWPGAGFTCWNPNSPPGPAPTTVMSTHSSCRGLGGPGATVAMAFGRRGLSPAPQHSLEAQGRCSDPTGLFRSCAYTGGFTVKSPGSVKKRPEWPVSISDACTSAPSVFSRCPGFRVPFIYLPSTCLLFPLLTSQSFPLMKSASIHWRGSIIFWQEDGDRDIPRSN